MNNNQNKCLKAVEDSLNCIVCVRNRRVCIQCFDFMMDLFSGGIVSPYSSVRSVYVQHYKNQLFTYKDD